MFANTKRAFYAREAAATAAVAAVQQLFVA